MLNFWQRESAWLCLWIFTQIVALKLFLAFFSSVWCEISFFLNQKFPDFPHLECSLNWIQPHYLREIYSTIPVQSPPIIISLLSSFQPIFTNGISPSVLSIETHTSTYFWQTYFSCSCCAIFLAFPSFLFASSWCRSFVDVRESADRSPDECRDSDISSSPFRCLPNLNEGS